MNLRICVGLIVLLAGLRAQADDTLDANQFWTQLQQTDAAISQALIHTDPGPGLAALQTQWVNVRRIRDKDAVIEIDLGWLTRPLAAGDSAGLRAAQRQIRALLAFHTQTKGAPGTLSLQTLAEILKDPRFQYPEPTPEPAPNPDRPGWQLPAWMGQALLAIVGTVAVGGLLFFVARTLRTQPARLALPISADDPQTASLALDRAAERASASDYRTAIRYLYLSALLSLDERGLIAYNASQTNREHLAQLKRQTPLWERLRAIIDLFEAVWYGYAPVDAVLYERFYQQIQQIQQQRSA